MSNNQSVRLLPTLSVIAEELENLSSEIIVTAQPSDTVYHGVRRFCGQKLQKDILYIITSEDAANFPVNTQAYLSTELISGKADHIYCPGLAPALVLEFLLDLFLEFQEQESRILSLTFQNATLDELCMLAEELLENAVCIHDNWFMILAKSPSGKRFSPAGDNPWELIPEQFLEEFRLDAEYQLTYQQQGAGLWDMDVNGTHFQTIYVNLYEKESYRGRLLITDTGRKLKKRDYITAELLAQQALVLLTAKRHRMVSKNRGTDDIIYDILNGKYTAASEFSALLKSLHWEKTDRFLCIRIQRQEPVQASTIDHILHRDLFLAFPGSYIMFADNQQCIIINLSKTPHSLPAVRHILSPLCRDYFQYGGISSPVVGIQELPVAYHQAAEALSQAFRLHDEHWIIYFYSCALEYTMMHLNTPMQLRHLAAPQLFQLMQQDEEKGTQFFETFKTYLTNERDIPKTAAQLIIHRTTLTYRLKKIQEILDLNLEDPNVRLYLQLSLKMLEQEKTVKLAMLESS